MRILQHKATVWFTWVDAHQLLHYTFELFNQAGLHLPFPPFVEIARLKFRTGSAEQALLAVP